MRTKAELLSQLQTMLRDVFTAAAAGTSQARIARAHGYVDGFMRALLDTGTAEHRELVALVARERECVSGPAIRTVETGDVAAA
jgi:hypothetical protein